MDISLSVEETKYHLFYYHCIILYSKLREKLGLKPLRLEHDASRSNTVLVNAAAPALAIKENQVEERIQRTKQRLKQTTEALQRKSVADEAKDVGVDDTRSWLSRIQKDTEASILEKHTSLMEKQNTRYTEKDLQGLRVGHDIDKITFGQDMILHLADHSVLDHQQDKDGFQDELVSTDVVEKDQLKKNLEHRKKKPSYTPYDTQPGGLLAKYNELEEQIEQGFVLGMPMRTLNTSADPRPHVSLDYSKHTPLNDYDSTLKETEPHVLFRKTSTTKKTRALRKKSDKGVLIPDLPSEQNTVQRIQEKKHVAQDVNFVDDDELQHALARTRAIVRAKSNTVPGEEIVRAMEELKSSADVDIASKMHMDNLSQKGLVITDTIEFVDRLRLIPAEDAIQSKDNDNARNEDAVMVEDEKDDRMDDASVTDHNEHKTPIETASGVQDNVLQHVITTEEPLVTGIAATLKLLRQRGLLETKVEDKVSEETFRKRQEFLRQKKIEQSLKEKEDEKRKRQREMELQFVQERQKKRKRNPLPAHLQGPSDDEMGDDRRRARRANVEQKRQDVRELQREYDRMAQEYVPSFKIRYTDDMGREVDTKEAYKMLSHRFHGNEPGKNKKEKYEHKKQEQIKREIAAATETGVEETGLIGVIREHQKKTGAAHVVLKAGHD